MRLGVLGGTFDPVHLGHQIIAEEARVKLSLDRVIFVPAGQPWFKDDVELSPSADRLEMLRLAVCSNANFHIDTQELERPGPSYTVDTLEELRSRLGAEVELYFIIGLDALAEMPRWNRPARLADLCHFAGMGRPAFTDMDVQGLEKAIPGISRRIHIVDNVLVDISSSDIRRRVQEGLPIRYLVPEGVERYIREKGLYKTK
ncbi:MAG: nicotinate-nucleotide adenylyltransferase [Dehalococcoidia bacterium]